MQMASTAKCGRRRHSTTSEFSDSRRVPVSSGRSLSCSILRADLFCSQYIPCDLGGGQAVRMVSAADVRGKEPGAAVRFHMADKPAVDAFAVDNADACLSGQDGSARHSCAGFADRLSCAPVKQTAQVVDI